MPAGASFFEYVVNEFPERQRSLVNLRGESGAHEAPYVPLLTRVPGAGVGESPWGVDP